MLILLGEQDRPHFACQGVEAKVYNITIEETAKKKWYP